MALPSRISSAISGWTRTDERKVLAIQLILLLTLSILLNFGYSTAREWRKIAEQNQLQTNLLAWDGLAWYVWVAVAPLMMMVIRQNPLMLGRLTRSLSRIIGWSVVLYLLVVNLRYLLRVLPNAWVPLNQDMPTDLKNYLYNTYRLWPQDFLVYCVFFAVSLSLDYAFKYRQRVDEALRLQVQAAQLQSDLARAELAALRGQLHPHFLFNCFNAIATLVRQRRNDEAVETVAQLSALLRLAIGRTTFQEIPLEQELDFVRRYLDLEHVRFGDKLKVDFAVEPAALAVLVPNILLQPLVENAIKHGISLRTTPGTVRVSANRLENRLHVEIIDDGADLPPPPDRQNTGIGLANTRARLSKLYGTDYRLDFIRRPAGGMLVALDLPWRLAPETKTIP